ncbi:hypothetical protein HAX54_001223 [Datura stramonium]|uniref:Uncharacterized protein n=1 Tax=Datura stramonium TaxID=4076 RepID=A0ABS8WQK7_DATST|nr:hypothetical protein [Datura stramonium]
MREDSSGGLKFVLNWRYDIVFLTGCLLIGVAAREEDKRNRGRAVAMVRRETETGEGEGKEREVQLIMDE